MIRIQPVILPALITALSTAAYTAHASGEAVREDMVSERYMALADSAYRMLGEGEYGQAETVIKEALRLQPGNSGNTFLFSNLGVAQMQQGKWQEALTSFDIALTRASRSTTILSHRARVWLAMDSVGRALEDLDSLLSIEPHDERALQTRGMLLLKRGGEEEKAAGDFQTLTDRYPANPWGYFGLGALAEGQENAEEAARHYRKALSLTDGMSREEAQEQGQEQILFRLALLYCRDERLEDASALLRQGLKEFPQSGELYAAMGLLHRMRYQSEESSADLQLARRYGAPESLVNMIERGGKAVASEMEGRGGTRGPKKR